MKQYNKSEIMKRAWNIFRSTKNTFSECLKRAWAWAKSVVCNEIRYKIADWFMNKNYDNFTTQHLRAFQSFGAAQIKKETEKAWQVELETQTFDGFESKYTLTRWIPKSVVSAYCV